MKVFVSVIAPALVALLFAASCSNRERSGQQHPDEIDTVAYFKKGDSVSLMMQEVLLKNVMKATEAGGPVYAVGYCNLKAMSLTDSLSAIYNCRIQRISMNYRNPLNKPTEVDATVLERMTSPEQARPMLISEAGNIVYYKPIRIAMPACLKCHGNENGQIDRNTLEAIRLNYPADRATGYKEGDLRGAWKITFRKPDQP